MAAAALCASCVAVACALATVVAAIRVRRLTAAAQHAAIEDRAARAVVPALVRGTRFENRWQINGDYSRNLLNLYVIRFAGAADANALEPFRDNCSAVARWSVIVCDTGLLDNWLERRGVVGANSAPAHSAFVAWTIGHEIGHVLAGDEPAHFQAASLDQQIAFSSRSHRQELAADAFVVRQLASNAERRFALESVALDLLNSEIRREVGPENLPQGAGIIFDYDNEYVVRYLDRGTHPENFVRAARILEAAGELPGNASLREMVKPLIEQLGGRR
jgi:hypothetical protein